LSFRGIVYEGGAHVSHTTNNAMEMTALREGLRALEKLFQTSPGKAPDEPIHVYLDSAFVLQGLLQWREGWKRRGWKKADGLEVKNRVLWEELSDLHDRLGHQLRFHHVEGHSSSRGNARVDDIARLLSLREDPELLSSVTSDQYSVALEEGLEGARFVDAKTHFGSTVRRGRDAAWYLSLVDSQLERHTSWSECEARVRGRAGARYKKVSSDEEEKKTLLAWGVSRT
jgi:ribonuclease HI